MKGFTLVLITVTVAIAATSSVLQSYAQTNSSDLENNKVGLILDTPQLVNSFGVPMDSISVNRMVQISANIDNLSDAEQDFVFQIKVFDSNENLVKEQWLSGMISAQKRVNSSISWLPEKEGTYTIVVSVGNDIDSLNYQNTISVEADSYAPIESCKEGLELIFKTTDGSSACVTPETAERLSQRGWANRADDVKVAAADLSFSNGELELVGQPYLVGDMIQILGKVNDPNIDFVTIEVLDDKNNVVAIERNGVYEEGHFKQNFETQIQWKLGEYWDSGTYTARVAADGVELSKSFEIHALSETSEIHALSETSE